MPKYLRNRGWTPVEVTIWLLLVVACITVVILVNAEVVGSWAFAVLSFLAAALALHRIRVESKQRKRSADAQDG
jgi:Flp pilus assembly protein TadB